jgi:hypothetical protein
MEFCPREVTSNDPASSAPDDKRASSIFASHVATVGVETRTSTSPHDVATASPRVIDLRVKKEDGCHYPYLQYKDSKDISAALPHPEEWLAKVTVSLQKGELISSPPGIEPGASR